MVPEPPETQDDVRPVGARAAAPVKVSGRYDVRAVLGEGGMGELLDCLDTTLDRHVALKIVRRDRRRRELESRFLREAR